MRPIKQTIVISVTLILFFNSCKTDNSVAVNKILPEFQVYVDRFIAEAKQRGMDISTTNLSIDYAVGNNTSSASADPQQVLVSKSLWATLPDMPKEIVIFHYLGIALLKRVEDNSLLPNRNLPIVCNFERSHKRH